jgi:hypothetical protein
VSSGLCKMIGYLTHDYDTRKLRHNPGYNPTKTVSEFIIHSFMGQI